MQTNPDPTTEEPAQGQSKLLLWVAIGTHALGILMLAFGVSFVLEANASRSWPTAKGTVENVRVTWRNNSSSNRTPPTESTSTRFTTITWLMVRPIPAAATRWAMVPRLRIECTEQRKKLARRPLMPGPPPRPWPSTTIRPIPRRPC